MSLYTPQMSEATRTNGGQSWDPGTQCGKDLLRSMELYFCFVFFVVVVVFVFEFLHWGKQGHSILKYKIISDVQFHKQRGSHDV